MKLRDSALLQLDELKKSVGLNKAIDAEVVYQLDAPTRAMLEPFGVDLEDVVSAGCHSFAEGSGEPTVKVIDRRNDYAACARSWKRRHGCWKRCGVPRSFSTRCRPRFEICELWQGRLTL